MQSFFVRLITLWFLLFLFNSALFACDDSSAILVTDTNNGDGSFTYVFDVCIEHLGLEGHPDEFDFVFDSGTVQPGFTPSSVFTSGGDEYVGSASGSTLAYVTGAFFLLHNSETNCFTATITVNGNPSIVTVITHAGLSAPECNIEIDLNIPPCNITAVDATDITQCEGTAFSLSASVSGTPANALTYTWTAMPATAISNLSSTSISDPIISANANTGTTTYTVTMDDGNCAVMDDIEVSILAFSEENTPPCEPVGIADNYLDTKNSLTVQPSLFKTHLQINVATFNKELISLIITDITGKPIYQQAIKSNQLQTIQFPNELAKGLYLVQVVVTGQRLVKKVIKY